METKMMNVFNLSVVNSIKYAYLLEEKKLVAVKPSWFIDFENKIFNVKFLQVSDCTEVPNESSTFYESIENFEKEIGKSYDRIIRSEEMDFNAIMSKFSSVYWSKDENGRKFVYVYENGKACKWYLDEHINFIANHKITWDCENLPDYYDSADDVYKFNDYIEINDKGEEIIHKGKLGCLLLDDDQKPYVDALKKAIEDCKSNGIDVCIDSSDGCYIMMYNRRNAYIGYYDADEENILSDNFNCLYKKVPYIEIENINEEEYYIYNN